MAARRKPTEPDTLARLTDSQALAMAALVGGSTDAEAAKTAGVTRQTVNTWRHTNPAFMAALAQARVTALSMELIPRTTLAQKMDALSSQANLAGYVAVILGAARLPLAMPMMMTPAGTLKPARVFVIGAGVAGLQAIATARRLGARVEAFDTRPVVEEQVHSLGARFVKVDLGETGQTRDGYAMELTSEQQARQREAMASVCAQADLVITTAKLFGKRAPVIITDPEEVAQTKYNGQPSTARAKLAFFKLGQVSLELIEPIGEPSTWNDQLVQHGESLHHIAFQVDGMARLLPLLAEDGMSTVQRGEYTGGRYAYVDATERLGTTLELLEND